MTSTWDRQRTAHLYRRAGFGASPKELDLAVSLGREGTVDRLVDYEKISPAGLDAFLGLYGFDIAGFSDVPFDRFRQLQRWWYLRMLHTPRPLEEKMTLFWHNHFATSIRKVEVQPMYAQNQIFRALGMGRFGDLLLEVSRDPAMLLWLDNATNVKNAPNENFAREVMELFTMGRGHYTQNDVTEGARALTGWTVDAAHYNSFTFKPEFHDDGVKTFLGNRGFFEPEDIIAILAARPETAAFITAKLARAFLGGAPGPELSQRLQDVYLGSGGEIRHIVREIFLSDDFNRTADQPDMVKSPVEFLVGANRALGTYTDATAEGWYWGEHMGESLFSPPNVAGWKGGRAWIDTSSYLWRMSFAATLSGSPVQWGDSFRWEPGRFFAGASFSSADALIDFLADRLNMVELSEALRNALRTYLAQAGEPLVWTPFLYDSVGRGAIFLLMSSPEYQLQ